MAGIVRIPRIEIYPLTRSKFSTLATAKAIHFRGRALWGEVLQAYGRGAFLVRLSIVTRGEEVSLFCRV